jgi:hypothetical protein
MRARRTAQTPERRPRGRKQREPDVATTAAPEATASPANGRTRASTPKRKRKRRN